MLRAAFVIGVVGAVSAGANAQQYWQFGSSTTLNYSYAGFGDTSDPATWDSITPNLAITRQVVQGIYNAATESNYIPNFSPEGTLWLFGNTVQDVLDGAVDITDFGVWQIAAGANPPSTVGTDAVLYSSADDTYIDIKFTAWGVGPGAGGSFAYERATPTPGTLALLGLGGIAATRRRR